MKEDSKKSIRDGIGEALVELGEKNKDIVVLTADVCESVRFHWFKEKFPERFIEVGIAEQNLVGVAAGLALSGKIPVMGAYAVFSPGRNWEQIRTMIAYNNLPVKIIGSHTGLVTGEDGFSHQALEDIALMNVLPNFSVISPADYFQAKKAIREAMEIKGPVYLRSVRPKTSLITKEDSPFEFGKVEVLFSNLSKEETKPKIALFGTGHLLAAAMEASSYFEKEGNLEIIVINIHTIKPIDVKGIVEIAKKVKGAVVVEEHQKIGGLGAIVSQVLAENHPLPLEFVAVEDKFGQSGKPEELLKAYGLDKENIINKIKTLAKRL